MIALLCAVLGGAMSYLAFGLDNVWWLAWFAPVPILWLAYGEARGWMVFVAAFFSTAMGMIYFYQAYGAMLLFDGSVLLVGNGLAAALTMLLARLAWRRLSSMATLLVFPTLWTAFEFMEGWVSPHGGWGAWGYTQVAWPAAIQLAAILGVYGITFLVCLFANGLAMVARGRMRAGGLGLAICAAIVAAGYFRLQQPEGPTTRVAALAEVSRDYTKAFRTGDPTAASNVTQSYATAIRSLSAQNVHVFVTPETGVEWNAITPIAEAARDTHSLVIAGAHERAPARDMAMAFVPGGRTVTYDKRHRLLPGESVYKPGTRSGVIGSGIGMAICKDLDFPRTIRSDAQAGLRLMIVPAGDFTKDGWMHARQAIMRGVENGFSVLRAAFNGLETISDARGRVLASAQVDHFGLTTIEADVPLGPGATPYARYGDVFSWLVVLGALGLIMATLRAPRP
jgi:apolipoprotein N-acyltransferase